ncbi:MAG TPA: ATP-binding protein [Roseiflexaceae bacterium]|nr:ATP-binding protein [Roseiflexaceae bacterium]
MARIAPEARIQLETFKGVKVKHPRLEEVDVAVSQAIDEHAGYTHVLLYGPTGVGKSTVTRRITERFLAEETNRAVVPVVWVEARPADTGTYARLDYYRQVLSALREHVAVKDRLMNLALSAKPSRHLRDAAEWLDLREAVEYALERLQVKAVVIDEAQHLMRVAAPHRPVDQLDWLKSITNRTNVLHVLVGPYELFDFRNLNGQAARRGRDVHFPRYRVEYKDERLAFVGALRYLLAHMPIGCDVEQLLGRWRWFAESSVGCVGILRDWLVTTVAALIVEEQPTLTLEALERFALQPAQRVRLEIDARTGEQHVESGNSTSQQQLQALLRLPTSSASASSTSVPRVTERTVPAATSAAPQRSGGRRGVRAPQRDRVGESAPQVEARRCTFAEVLPLSAAEMVAAGVTKVECPECATVRTLQPRGVTVRFPSHQRRKTRTASSETRWIREGEAWTITSG